MVDQLQEKVNTMATNPNPRPMSDEEVKATRKRVTHLMRHPSQHPSRFVPEEAGEAGSLSYPTTDPPTPVTHYALDLETPPVLACETNMPGAVYTTFPERVTCPDCMMTEHFPKKVLQQDITEPPNITANDVLMVAADLLVDANYDYGRAIVDMTTQLIGAGPDDTILMTRILRSLAQGD